MTAQEQKQKDRNTVYVKVYGSLGDIERNLKEMCNVINEIQDLELRYKMMDIFSIHGYITGMMDAMKWYLPTEEDTKKP